MKTNIFTVAMSFLFLASTSVALANTPVGVVESFRGTVVISPDINKPSKSPVTKGMPFYAGDWVSTGADGRVKLKFTEGANELLIGTNTKLQIERASIDAVKNPGTTMKLMEGELRAVVNRRYTGAGTEVFLVKTANAVCGIRGTIVSAIVKGGQSTFAVERGSVSISALQNGAAHGSEVIANAGEFVTVSQDQKISKPSSTTSNDEIKKSIETLKMADASKEAIQFKSTKSSAKPAKEAANVEKNSELSAEQMKLIEQQKELKNKIANPNDQQAK